MSNEIDSYGLFALTPEVRAKKLARLGVTEEEYREKALMQIERNKRQAEAEARGETVHGWSTKTENPGWSDDKIVGSLVDESE